MADSGISYTITPADGTQLRYTLQLDGDTYRLQEPEDYTPPAWTRLGVEQCANCPLQEASTPHCPTAANLAVVVADVGTLVSYEQAQLVVDFGDRQLTATTSVQQILSSLIGLLMASSACPHCIYLRPMARFHHPLSGPLETVYRAASMYLLAQYFVGKEGGTPDLTLDGLSRIYAELQLVNRGMAKRLRRASREDGAINAVVLLDMLAKDVPVSIDESLQELQGLFAPYCTKGGG
ncbi:MAG: hypothetical protein AB1810_13780 [Pseudomonadota bacterium]